MPQLQLSVSLSSFDSLALNRSPLEFEDLLIHKYICCLFYTGFTSLHKYDRRHNLWGMELTNTFEVYPGYCDWNDTTKTIEGHDSEIYIELSQILNFTFKNIRSPDKSFGIKTANGTWQGMLGLLHSGIADTTSCTVTMTPERGADFQFSSVVNVGKITLIMALPKTTLTNFWVYVQVFRPELWLIIFLGWIFLAAVLSFINRKLNIIQAFETVFAFLIQRGDDQTGNTRIAFKVVNFTSALTCFLIFTSYTALLTASMVTRPFLPTMQTFADVMNEGYKLFLLKGSSSELAFRHAPAGSDRHKIFHDQILGNKGERLYTVGNDALKILENDPKSLVFEWVSAFRHHPGVIALPGFKDYDKVQAAFALPKDSEIAGTLNHQLKKLKEAGVTTKKKLEWFESDTYESETNVAEALDYNNVIFPFMSMAGFFAFSIFVSLIERIVIIFNPRKTACGYSNQFK